MTRDGAAAARLAIALGDPSGIGPEIARIRAEVAAAIVGNVFGTQVGAPDQFRVRRNACLAERLCAALQAAAFVFEIQRSGDDGDAARALRE